MSNELTKPAEAPITKIRALLEGKKKDLAMALPKHLTVDRLLRVALTACNKTPKLLECTRESLLACVMDCASLGLEPDATQHTLRIVRPELPDWLGEVTVRGLQVGQGSVDLLFRRHHDKTSVIVLEQHGSLHVVVEW